MILNMNRLTQTREADKRIFHFGMLQGLKRNSDRRWRESELWLNRSQPTISEMTYEQDIQYVSHFQLGGKK
jgi:hypothetical protein